MLVNKLDVDVLLLMLCRPRFCKSFQSVNYVPDQIGTLSQVGTKKISKGGWTI